MQVALMVWLQFPTLVHQIISLKMLSGSEMSLKNTSATKVLWTGNGKLFAGESKLQTSQNLFLIFLSVTHKQHLLAK